MAENKIWIAFRNGNSIPAAILGKDEDVKVAPHDPVQVPETYGRHLIADKFAYAAEKPKAKSAAKEKGKTDDGAAKAEAEKAKALADAEKAVADATAAVEAAGDDMVAKAAAEDALKAAEATLAGLKG